jgi:AcrR family transcriptional regulator
MVEVGADGRVLRGARNREAIADAVLAFYDEGELRPSATQLAERAGVSVRSVHNHFADMESLRAQVAERQWARQSHLAVPPPPDLPLEMRVELLVERRGALYEAITPVRRAALTSVHDSPAIARRLSQLARYLRNQLEVLFAAELASRPAEVLDAIDLCTSWDAWNRLRTQQRLGVAATRRVVVSMVRAVLAEEEQQ